MLHSVKDHWNIFPIKTLVFLIDHLSNQIYVNNDNGFSRFCKTSIDTLNSFAPIKKKFVRANQMPFITKDFSREIIIGQSWGIPFQKRK